MTDSAHSHNTEQTPSPSVTLLAKVTDQTIDEINEARESGRAGDFTPIQDLLFDSALLLHGAARAAAEYACISSLSNADKSLDMAIKAIEATKGIFLFLSEYNETNRLSTIAGNLFQENLERIMNYIARKGGRIERHVLLTSRVIQGNAIDYDKHLAALIDAGFLSETHTGRRKDTTYFMVIPEEPAQIEVLGA